MNSLSTKKSKKISFTNQSYFKYILLLALLVLSVISLLIGPINISLWDIFSMTHEQHIVFFAGRVPRLVTIIVTGMSMSICGLIMQCLTNNKFVSPTTAGTMDAARLGILVSMLVGSSKTMLVRSIYAFVFTLFCTIIFIKILDRIKFKDTIFVPLVGIMYGNILLSITTFFALRHDMVQNVNAWLIGDFSSVLRGNYEIIFISIPMLAVAYIFANKFVIAGMGEEFSKNLGLNHKLVMNIGLSIVSIISSVILLTVGIIPFLGLVVPNIISMVYGDNLKKTLPITAISGALFLLICDIIGRTIIHPFEIPINLTVGIIGGFIFLIMLFRRKANA